MSRKKPVGLLALTTKECISCRGKAADLYRSRKYTGMPVGNNVADYPNFGGRHQTHMDLDSVSTGTPMVCGTCHNGIDNGTLAHYQNAYGRTNNIYAKRSYPGAAAFTATYGATSAGIVFTPSTLKCSNVSCHGAQDTPVGWNATGITCKGCHKLSGTSVNGAPANYYNDYTDTWITHNDHISRGRASAADARRATRRCPRASTSAPSGISPSSPCGGVHRHRLRIPVDLSAGKPVRGKLHQHAERLPLTGECADRFIEPYRI